MPRGVKLVTIADTDPRSESRSQLGCIRRSRRLIILCDLLVVEYSGEWHQYYSHENSNGGHLGSGSCHVATARNATACVSFESAFFFRMFTLETRRSFDSHVGAHVWVIGDMYPDRGMYSVSVDGGLFETFSGHEPKWRGFVIKYERRFASPGPHRLVIRNDEDKGFCFDAVMY